MNHFHACSAVFSAFLALFLIGFASTADANVFGLDISSFQGDVNWTSVAADSQGYKFAWTKATEGMYYQDQYMQDNLHDGTIAGLHMGVYDFARPDLYTPAQEANYFVSFATVQPAGTSFQQSTSENAFGPGRLVPALDMETGDGAHVGATSLSDWCNKWAAEVFRLTTTHPVIYCNANYAKNFLTGSPSVTGNPLWIASYNGSNPSTDPTHPMGPWSTWTFWQYTSGGTVSGISGSVDLDQFNGSLASFEANFVVPTPEPSTFLLIGASGMLLLARRRMTR